MRCARTLVTTVLVALPLSGLGNGPRPAAGQAPGAAADSALLAGFEWREIGPDRGGRSQAITGHPDRPEEYFFGATGGGLWHTADGGETWASVTDGQVTSSSVGAVAWSVSDPEVLYIGMGETELRGSITQGDGVYRSADGGETWEHVGLAETQAIGRIRIHPRDPDRVYVAALGHPYGPNPERGVFRSTDGGDTWEKVLFVSDSAGAVDLILDPSDPETVYATTWQVYRTPWKMWGGGPGSGLWKSTDGGDTWTELTGNPGMPAPPHGKIGIAVSPADPDRLWAVVEASEGGVFRSDDGGRTWTRTNAERKIRQRHFYYSRIYADPVDRNTVYALNVGLWKSTDGGETFEEVDVFHPDHHDLWIDPDDPDRIADANDGGGTISVNGGESWTDQEFPTAQFYHVMATSDYPYHVCGAQQDNSTACVPSDDWTNEHNPWVDGLGGWLYAVGGGESGYIAQSPTDPDVFYAGSQGALLTRYDRSSGQIRDIQPDPRFFSGEPASALRERWQWTFPIVFDRHDPETLYIASQHVWRTRDDGQSWERISPDLTYADPETLGPTGGLITMDMNGPEIYATVFALAPSRTEPGTIWAGSDDGRVHITRDGGGEWTEITPPGMEKFTRVSIIDASHHEPGTAYVAANRYQMDDRGSYLWRTRDHGATWTRIGRGIRGPTRVIREDPVTPGLLYVGTEHGVHVSFDDGETWRGLGRDLPDTPVRDLVVTDHDVVLGTHGRGFQVLDDIEPLRQWGAEAAGAGAHLFRPADAVRRIEGGFLSRAGGTATFQYWLSEAVDSVAVQVLDAAGEVVRTLRGPPPEEEGDRPRFGPPPTAEPTAGAGLGRAEWDLRYPGATGFEGMVIWSGSPTRGPVAPPGEYGVRLITESGETSDTTETRPFRLEMDPRLEGVTPEDLRAQFDLAVRIRDATDRANRGVIRVRTIRCTTLRRLEAATGEDLPGTPCGEEAEAGEGPAGEGAEAPAEVEERGLPTEAEDFATAEAGAGDEPWVTMEEATAALEAAREAGADAELVEAARALLEAQREVEEALYQVQNRSPQDPLNFPIRLNNRLAALRRSVETGNARPTDAHRRVFEELHAELEEQVTRLDATLADPLRALNAALEARGLEPVRSEP